MGFFQPLLFAQPNHSVCDWASACLVIQKSYYHVLDHGAKRAIWGRRRSVIGKMAGKPGQAKFLFLIKEYLRESIERKSDDNFATRESEIRRIKIRYNGTCFSRVSVKINSVFQ